jgi:hypothetical protein
VYTQESIASSGYEGWVVWLDGTPVRNPGGVLLGYDNSIPIFEAVPHNPHLLNIAEGTGQEQEVRAISRQTMDWEDVPHDRINTLEYYGFRGAWDQPVCTITKIPDHRVRWIQFKCAAMIVQTVILDDSRGDETGHGQQRTGVTAVVLGYWDQTVGEAKMLEFKRNGSKGDIIEFSGRNHPCWPKPLGFAIGPHVLGLNDFPAPPDTIGEFANAEHGRVM